MIAVGSAGISKVMVGGTAAKAVYLGTTEVWTARSKVALKGVNAAYTALTVPIPAHQPGDLIRRCRQNRGRRDTPHRVRNRTVVYTNGQGEQHSGRLRGRNGK